MIVDAVVSRGVIPEAPTAMLGVTVPVHRTGVAPPPLLPVEKSVMVVPEAPLDGKSMLAAGETEPAPALEVVNPVERATFCRA